VRGSVHQGAPRKLEERKARRAVGNLAGSLCISCVRLTTVSDVDTELVVGALQPIWGTRTETATRLRGRIESILDWATVSGYRQGDNPARWRGHLENLLANPGKIAPVKNRPALPWPAMGDFMAKLVDREGISARAVQFAILMACRSGEVRGASWAEFDLGREIVDDSS
jgi:integrase